MSVVTRFAPSPTGTLHIGSVRTALFSWLYARKHQGEFLLRIEDTDQERSTKEATQLIFESLDWLELDYDRAPCFQSQRTENYRLAAESLIESGRAYFCTCTPERLNKLREEFLARKAKPRYDGKCRDLNIQPTKGVPTTIRFRNPEIGNVVVNDLVQGKVEYQNSELDDLIIVRANGMPTYNFAVVVDEIDMGCTHVIRGDDHLNNTPRQMNIFAAFGQPIPEFAHVPMILSSEGRKLSKRHHDVGVLEWRDDGYLRETILNYLVRLGWSHGDQEIFSVDELIGLFDVSKIHRSPSSLDPKKVQWLNHQHMMRLKSTDGLRHSRPFFKKKGIEIDDSARTRKIFEVHQPRARTLVEFVEKSSFFFADFDSYDEKAAEKALTSQTRPLLIELRQSVDGLSDWSAEAIKLEFNALVERLGVKFVDIAQPARVALTGTLTSPGIDETIELLGREKVLERIDSAVSWIANLAESS